MKPKAKPQSVSELLLSKVVTAMKERGIPLHRLATQIGFNYITIYYTFHPERRNKPRGGKPRFSYELGHALELWLKGKNQADK